MGAIDKEQAEKPRKISFEERERLISKKFGRCLWAQLVSPGSTLVTRANAMAVAGRAFQAAAVACLAWTIGSSFGVTSFDAPTAEGLFLKREILNEWAKGATIPPQSVQAMANTTPVEEMANNIVPRLESGALKISPGYTGTDEAVLPCVTITSLSESWLNPSTGTANIPRCKLSSDGKSYWIATFLMKNNQPAPHIGILLTENGKRQYYNFDPHLSTAAFVPGRSTVSPETIPNHVANDWPGSMGKQADVTAETGWRGWIQKFNNKK